MKKIMPICIVGIVVLSGLGAANVVEDTTRVSEIIDTITFTHSPVTTVEDDYVTLQFDGTNAVWDEAGKPMLPIYRTTFTFSHTVKIMDVSCVVSEMHEQCIDGKIKPAPEPMPRSLVDTVDLESLVQEDKAIYESTVQFPGVWYDYRIRCGADSDGSASTFVTVEIYPVQYVPATNMLYYVESVELQIRYHDPGGGILGGGSESYDLIIIAPSTFTRILQRLVDHKNDFGVATKLVTTEEIYDEYSGRDKPEQIKYFILEANETWGTMYFLLVGGLKSYIYAKDKDDCNQGSTAWHLPVRYANIQHSAEIGCLSDLYYGDLYRYNETSMEWEFEDWDSNGDGVLAKWTNQWGQNDELDLVPDVIVGRLACRNKLEVNIVVNKIINYEKTPPDRKPWFKNMVVVAGKTFNIVDGQPDGEIVCDTALEYMGSLVEPVRLYASNNDTGGPRPIPEDIKKAINQGAGYVNFQGHGNPVRWDTIWADGEYPRDWCGGISIYQYPQLFNLRKLPVVIVGGCHNGLFNVTLIKTLLSMKLGNDHWYWTHGSAAPVCFSWGLVMHPYGGAIASTGCTGYGIGGGGPVSLSAELESNFFYEIGQDGATTPGAAHSGAIRKFIQENAVRQTEAFCITNYQFFGDPSLKLGGFS
jgi:hypothetical protein